MEISKQIDILSGFVTADRFRLLQSRVEQRSRYLTVGLENLYQSHNASAVLRTCDCLGIQDVHVLETGNQFKVSDDIALGASKWLEIHRKKDPVELIATLRSKGYRIVATSSHNDSCLLDDFRLENGPTALLFGTEMQGLSETLMKQADEFVKIPMYGFTESFNISVSAAIILYTLTQKLRTSTIPFLLNEDEKKEILLTWLKASVKDADAILQRFA